MTIQVNLEEAQQQFAQLFSQVLQGEEIIIIDGQERARLTPTKPTISSQSGRVPGIDEGHFFVPDDFDELLPPKYYQSFYWKKLSKKMEAILDTNALILLGFMLQPNLLLRR